MSFGQVVPPQGITYQAVIIDRSVKELPGKDITERYYSNVEMVVKFSILESQTGPTEYEETQNAKTDAYGLLNLVIGQGTPNGVNFNTIDWGKNAKWLRVEIDFNKKGKFELFSLEKMWSVPYAIYSERSAISDADSSSTNELQTLSITPGKGKISISKGNSIFIEDSSSTNELQLLSITPGKGTLSISNGNSIKLADSSATNELQSLLLIKDTIYLTKGGGFVKLFNDTIGPWNLKGNSGTNPLNNFLGTRDNVPLNFRVNNNKAGIIHPNGTTMFGIQAGNNNSGLYNTGLGCQALFSNTTGNNNTAIGFQPLLTNTTGSKNISIGSLSLFNNKTGNSNVAIGNYAIYGGEGSNLVAIGDSSMTTGGSENTAVGAKTLRGGKSCTAVGYYSLRNNGGSDNTAIGANSLFSNTKGDFNTAVGMLALYANTTGWGNTATGRNALQFNTTGLANTASGNAALESNTTGDNNVGIGGGALLLNTTGDNNTAIGSGALMYNTTGNSNVGLGIYSLYNNTTKTNLVAIGDSALFKNGLGATTVDHAIHNTAIGSKSLCSNTIGRDNTSCGYNSLTKNTTGYENTAIGMMALNGNTTGIYNTAIGAFALYANIAGSENNALGKWSLAANLTGEQNSAFGNLSLGSNTTGNYNTAFGNGSLLANKTGSNNTAVGYYSLANTTGDYNTSLGRFAFYNGSSFSNSTALGYFTVISASNQVRVGNNAVTSIGGQVGWTTLSDGRFKTDLKENVPGLAFISKLRPVTYFQDIDAIAKFMKISDSLRISESEIQAGALRRTGLIAQEVEKAANELGFDFSGIDKPKNNEDYYGLRYAEFTVPLIKAVQEQQMIIENLKKIVEKQQMAIDLLISQIKIK